MSKKVLICDDEEGIREALRLILSDHCDVIMADGGEQCLDILSHADDIGVVLLDIRMPKISGVDVLRQIREKHGKLPVVLITGYKGADAVAECSQLGADGYIVKPFEAPEIIESVKRFV